MFSPRIIADLLLELTRMPKTASRHLLAAIAGVFIACGCGQSDAQEILLISLNGTEILDNDAPEEFKQTIFPSTHENGSSQRILGLFNFDSTTLTLALPIQNTGANPSNFSAIPETAVIAPFQLSLLYVTFSPGGAGLHTATINISNNDADEASFQLNVSGSAYNLFPPSRPDLSVTFKKRPRQKFDFDVGANLLKGYVEVSNLAQLPLESGAVELWMDNSSPFLFDSTTQLLATIPFGSLPALGNRKKPKKLKVKFKDVNIGDAIAPRIFARVKPVNPDKDADYWNNQDFEFAETK
jgi:hypothetical protein